MFEQKPNIIEKPVVEIQKNVLRYRNAVIQLRNISFFAVSPIPKQEYPLWAIMGIILSFLVMCMAGSKEELGDFAGAAAMALAVCAVIIGKVYYNNSKLGKYLMIHLNSGKRICFSSEQDWFLEETGKILLECMNDLKGEYKMDFQNCNITNSQISEKEILNNSTMAHNITGSNVNSGMGNHIMGQASGIEIQNADWEKAYHIFDSLLEKYHPGSPERECCKMAREYCRINDSLGLRKFFAEKAELFMEIFKSAASTGIVELFRKITGIG